MGYLAIARKWRPSRFEDLVGQAHVVQTLKNAITLNRVHHAYLFSGARGIGKTSVARILAKALRCPNAKEATPCNECAECTAINDSRSVDVVEIDGASNNGVEAVRGIRENVAYSASSGFYKVYIIDEVHMLSISAFNALLKTLEEPPKHVVFIFATTEVQKIPLTVLGRCQRFEFRRLTQAEIVARLVHILTAENVTIAEEGLRLIASHSDGSLRDALSLLDQVLSYASRDEAGGAIMVDERQVVDALGVSETSAVTDFLKFVIRRDLNAVIALIGENYLAGVDLKHFAERCLEELRLLYLAALARENNDSVTAESLDISATRMVALQELAKEVPLIQLERMAQIFSKTIPQLSWSSLPRFVLEMAAVRMSKLDALSKIEEALMKGGGGTIEIVTPAAAAPAPEPTRAAPPKPSAPPPPVRLAPEAAAYPEDDDNGYAPQPISMSATPPPQLNSDPQGLWENFVQTVTKRKPLLGSLLRHANYKVEPAPGGAKAVTIGFAEGSFYEQQTSDQKYRKDIEEHVRGFFGKETVYTLSSSRSDAKNSIETTKLAEAAALKKDALENPTVLKLKEALGAEVVNVDVEV